MPGRPGRIPARRAGRSYKNTHADPSVSASDTRCGAHVSLSPFHLVPAADKVAVLLRAKGEHEPGSLHGDVRVSGFGNGGSGRFARLRRYLSKVFRARLQSLEDVVCVCVDGRGGRGSRDSTGLDTRAFPLFSDVSETAGAGGARRGTGNGRIRSQCESRSCTRGRLGRGGRSGASPPLYIREGGQQNTRRSRQSRSISSRRERVGFGREVRLRTDGYVTAARPTTGPR